ncbi:MAG: hypothetical protein ABI778_11560 [Ignavibacteriota bacterium]
MSSITDLNDAEQWLDFKHKLSLDSPDFFESLRKKHPQLKPREVKVCALLFSDCSTKEIGNKLGMQDHAVDVMRSRLRDKFSLDKDEVLSEYLKTI